MIIYKHGDVFRASEDILIHGCNCFHTMGAGVAKIVRQYYPGAYLADLDTKYGDIGKMGTYSQWKGQHHFYDNKEIIVINLYTQFKYGNSFRPFNIRFFEKGLISVINDFPNNSIAMPKIGSGLGGENWETIEETINNICKQFKKNITVYMF